MSEDGVKEFPPGFIWGAATASYQIEGAVSEGGRAPSIWDTFSHTPGKVRNGDTGDVACDHFHRLEEDLDLMVELGINSYRFSIAWPRIQPSGKGPVNLEGLDFYRRLVDGLGERGITAAATLYHWDLPQALEDAGGWRVRDTSYRFAEYAELCVDGLGDSVGMWITLNEPWCSSWLGHAYGFHAPGMVDLGAALAANHHLLLGHGLAVEALRAGTSAPVGITLNLANVRAASDHEDDVRAARLVDGVSNRLFLDPIFRGEYPEDMVHHFDGLMPTMEENDLSEISRPIDFLGINYYQPTLVGSRDRVPEHRAAGYLVDITRPVTIVDESLRSVGMHRPGVRRTTMDWEIDPDSLRELLVGVRENYTSLPLYITENGCANDDYVAPDGLVHDEERTRYLDGHLSSLHDAIAAGVDVKGYFVWSLLDNFEWSEGYSKRFGITWVDYDTGRRVPKESFRFYQKVASSNSLVRP
jgi:beta-glucosidase